MALHFSPPGHICFGEKIPNNRKNRGTIMFQNKVVVITGGAMGIGKCIAEEFTKQGAHVCVIDCAP